jgi:hypothetical protein
VVDTLCRAVGGEVALGHSIERRHKARGHAQAAHEERHEYEDQTLESLRQRQAGQDVDGGEVADRAGGQGEDGQDGRARQGGLLVAGAAECTARADTGDGP